MSRYTNSTAILAFLIISCTGGDQSKKSEAGDSENKPYWVGMIQQGPAWTAEITPQLEELQKTHMANIQRMADSGYLKLAGPFVRDTSDESSFLRGLFFFDVESQAKARELVNSDPAVQARRLTVQLFEWYGPIEFSYREPVEMTVYRAVVYYKGENWTATREPDFDSLAVWQLEELKKYDPQGRVVLEGPFKRSRFAQAPISMFIYDADSLSWLKQVAAGSLPVEAGILAPVVLDWYGPVGLGQPKR